MFPIHRAAVNNHSLVVNFLLDQVRDSLKLYSTESAFFLLLFRFFSFFQQLYGVSQKSWVFSNLTWKHINWDNDGDKALFLCFICLIWIHAWVILSPFHLLHMNYFYSGCPSWPPRHWRPNSSFLGRLSGWNRDCSAPDGSGSRFNTQRYGVTLGSTCSYWEHKYHGSLNEGTYATTSLIKVVFIYHFFLLLDKLCKNLVFRRWEHTLLKCMQASASYINTGLLSLLL